MVSLLSGAAVLSADGSQAHLDVQPPDELMLDRSSCSTDASMKREHATEEIAPCTVFCRNTGAARFNNN
jgi:hypothetical protein